LSLLEIQKHLICLEKNSLLLKILSSKNSCLFLMTCLAASQLTEKTTASFPSSTEQRVDLMGELT